MTGVTQTPSDPVRGATGKQISLYEAVTEYGYSGWLRVGPSPGFAIPLDLKQVITESPPNGHLNTMLKKTILQYEESYDVKLARLEAKFQAQHDKLLSKVEARKDDLLQIRAQCDDLVPLCQNMLVKLDSQIPNSNLQRYSTPPPPLIVAESSLSTATAPLPQGRDSRGSSRVDDDVNNRRTANQSLHYPFRGHYRERSRSPDYRDAGRSYRDRDRRTARYENRQRTPVQHPAYTSVPVQNPAPGYVSVPEEESLSPFLTDYAVPCHRPGLFQYPSHAQSFTPVEYFGLPSDTQHGLSDYPRPSKGSPIQFKTGYPVRN